MGTDRPVIACDAPELALFKEGPVRLGDFDLQIQRIAPRQRHKRMAESLAFDICEFSLVDYLHGFQHGLQFTAIPSFPHRIFRHRDIWVSVTSGIGRPEELAGRRIGIQSWTNSASVWQRGLLADDFGVDLSTIEWVVEITAQRGAASGPKWARIFPKEPDRSLDQMLASGAIDALMLPRPPELSPDESTRIRPLFTDAFAAEQEYRLRTGIFPIMHVMVIKNDLLRDRPTIANAVYRGVQSALDGFVERRQRSNAPSVVWPNLTWSEQEKYLGPRPWPAGVEANCKELEVLIGYAVKQGILDREIAPADLFYH